MHLRRSRFSSISVLPTIGFSPILRNPQWKEMQMRNSTICNTTVSLPSLDEAGVPVSTLCAPFDRAVATAPDDGNRAIFLPSRSESWQKRISIMGWLSTSIVHDLRNPLGTVFAGAEMLMQLDPASTQGKRLAANIYRAAVRMRELLADLAGASCGNKSTGEICEILLGAWQE